MDRLMYISKAMVASSHLLSISDEGNIKEDVLILQFSWSQVPRGRQSSFTFWIVLWFYEYSANTKSIYKGLIEASFATQIWLPSQADKITTANSIIINGEVETLYSSSVNLRRVCAFKCRKAKWFVFIRRRFMGISLSLIITILIINVLRQ